MREVGVPLIARRRYSVEYQANRLTSAMMLSIHIQAVSEPIWKPTSSSSNCPPEVMSSAYSRRSLTSIAVLFARRGGGGASEAEAQFHADGLCAAGLVPFGRQIGEA